MLHKTKNVFIIITETSTFCLLKTLIVRFSSIGILRFSQKLT